MRFSNVTDHSFWDAKYALSKPHYSLKDPYYGERGLLVRTFIPWLEGAKNILEIGCGSSRYLMFFNMVANLDTYGIDFSVEGLQNLKSMSSHHRIEHKLYYGDMFLHEIEGKKFDVVFHSGLVEHFSDLPLLFERCRFFCKDCGLMIFLMPNMQNLAWRWHRLLCPVNFGAHIKYTNEQIILAASKYFTPIMNRAWGYPQLYAGGPPESVLAKIVKYINLGLVLWISLTVLGYTGSVNRNLASTWLSVCKPG